MIRLWDEPLSEEDKERIADLLASKIERWGLSVPAILWLEMHKPLARFAANSAIVFSPFVVPFTGINPSTTTRSSSKTARTSSG